MIIYPPERFDLNEWFIIFSATINIVFVAMLRKRFSSAMTTLILLLNIYLGQVCDLLIGLPPYDLYDANDNPKYEIFDFVLHYISYPPVLYIILHFYDKWKLNEIRLILYIGGVALLIVGLEWLAVLAHVFKYKKWHLSYSFFVYIGVIILNILFFHLSRYLLQRKRAIRNPGDIS